MMIRASRSVVSRPHRAAAAAAAAGKMTYVTSVDQAEVDWKGSVMPALASLPADTGKLYALNVYSVSDFAAFDDFVQKGGAIVNEGGYGRLAFYGKPSTLPGVKSLGRPGMTFDGFNAMALLEWNSSDAMLDGFKAIAGDEECVKTRNAGLDVSTWACFSPFPPRRPTPWTKTWSPTSAAEAVTDETELEFFTGLGPALAAAAEGSSDSVYCLNCYKFNDLPKYPDRYSGEKMNTGKDAHRHYMDAIVELCPPPDGEVLFYGDLTPGVPSLCRDNVNLVPRGYDSIALMRYENPDAMVKLGGLAECTSAGVHRVAGVEEQTWACYEAAFPFE
eukprot:SAG31_NODE_270_length_18732_cov_9.342618_6_plen_332_part_00